MSLKDNKTLLDAKAEVVFLDEENYDVTLSSYNESIEDMVRDKNKLFSSDMKAEEACPFELKSLLSDVNESIETNYQYITEILQNTYRHLSDFESNIKGIDSEASAAISHHNPTSNVNRNEVK